MRVAPCFSLVGPLLAAGCALPGREAPPPPPTLAWANVRASDWQTIRLLPRELAAVDNGTLFITLRSIAPDTPGLDMTTDAIGHGTAVIGTATAGADWVWRTLSSAGDTVEIIVGDHAIRLLGLESIPDSAVVGSASDWAARLRIIPWPPNGQRSRRGLLARGIPMPPTEM